MDIGSLSSVSPQILAALAAIQQSQAAELAVAIQLEQGFQQASTPANPDLGQLLSLSV